MHIATMNRSSMKCVLLSLKKVIFWWGGAFRLIFHLLILGYPIRLIGILSSEEFLVFLDFSIDLKLYSIFLISIDNT